jgi:hypothetical protein
MTEVAIAVASLNRMLELGRPEYVRLTFIDMMPTRKLRFATRLAGGGKRTRTLGPPATLSSASGHAARCLPRGNSDGAAAVLSTSPSQVDQGAVADRHNLPGCRSAVEQEERF